MNLTADLPPKPFFAYRYDYEEIARAAEQLEEGTGLRIDPCPSNITMFRRYLRNYIMTDRYDIFTRDGECWIVRDCPKEM